MTETALERRWYSPAEVAQLLGYGLSKVKTKIATGELRSIKDGKYRRILPQCRVVKRFGLGASGSRCPAW